MSDEQKKIIIDEDWKSQVEKEREELATHKDDSSEPPPGPGEIPPASFPMLITSIGTQAMMALGQVPDPMSGKAIYHPELARHHIDTLVVLQEKTVGNLTNDEKDMLTNFIQQLRELFVAMGEANPTATPPPNVIS
jgi:hypothetical protein